MAATVVPTLLNCKNYDIWSSRIKKYLEAENLWDIVEGTYKPEAWRQKNDKALYAIQNSCGDDTYIFIKDKTTAKEAWNTLYVVLERYKARASDKQYKLQPSDEIDTRTILQAYTTDLDEAYWTPTDLDDCPELAMEEGRTGGHYESNANNIRETFIKYVESKDWDNAIKFLRQHPQLGSETTSSNGTALHHAVQPFSKCSMRCMEPLVDLMENEDLAIQDDLGRTALYYLIREYPESVEVAKRMVAKNDNLLTILPSGIQEPLVVQAERQEKGERMARYLYSLTPRETLRVSDGAQLVSLGFRLQRFDIAWELIQHYPQLAVAKDNDGDIPLVTLASNHQAFFSGTPLSPWERCIYMGIRIKPLLPKPESDHSDQRHLSNKKENQGHLIFSVMGLFRGLMTNLQKLFGISHVSKVKLMHKRVMQFLPIMCKAVNLVKDPHEIKCLEGALFHAAEGGHADYIIHFCRNELNDKSFPIAVSNILNEKGQSLFQIAVECRHYNVYNHMYALHGSLQEQDKYCKYGQSQSNQIRDRVGRGDYFGNNMLHTVASITQLSQIDYVRGAALQMQRELQWFKKVESIANPKDRESLNVNNKTPREVFKKNHKKMAKEAEKSLKEAATSFTVVVALIVTTMFAATFTFPGGNDEKRGLPKRVFREVIFADAISLFSSTTSIIMFLGILTSSYSEDDFLNSLPKKMIIGLYTLLVSLITMLYVFSMALYIMLDRKPSMVLPIIFLGNVPVYFFYQIQLPLLVELLFWTFRNNRFDKKPNKKLF